MLLHYSSSYCFQLKTRSQLRDVRPSETEKNWSWIMIKNKSNHVLVEITEANVACFLRQLSTRPKTYLRNPNDPRWSHVHWTSDLVKSTYFNGSLSSNQKISVLCHAAGFSRLNGSFSASISRPSWVSKNTSQRKWIERSDSTESSEEMRKWGWHQMNSNE